MRALFKAAVYIEWILLGYSEKKATYYYVHNLRSKRLLLLRFQPGSTNAQEFATMMRDAGLPITDQLKNTARSQVSEIDRILAQSTFAPIDAEYEALRDTRPSDRSWYVPLGERNLRTMCKTIDIASQPRNRVALYVFVYAGASDAMHASSYEHHIKFGAGGQVTFEPIRSIEGFGTVLRFATILAMSTFRKALSAYRPDELANFGRKYAEKWKREFMNFPSIAIKRETTRI
jgi:hypothetical protein